MRPNTFIALATAFAVLAGTAAPAAAPPSIAYTTELVERKDPQCPAQASAFHCPHIAFAYPIMERGPRPAAAAAINHAIMDLLLTSTGEPRKVTNIDAAMTTFMQGYQQYKQLPGATRAYWEERTVTVRYQSDRLASLQFDLSFFFGGRHPQYASTFASFDAATGAKIGLADVLVAAPNPAFADRREELQGLSRHQTGNDPAGRRVYLLQERRVCALRQLLDRPGRHHLLLQPVRDRPYAMGPTELLLTYRESGA